MLDDSATTTTDIVAARSTIRVGDVDSNQLLTVQRLLHRVISQLPRETKQNKRSDIDEKDGDDTAADDTAAETDTDDTADSAEKTESAEDARGDESQLSVAKSDLSELRHEVRQLAVAQAYLSLSSSSNPQQELDKAASAPVEDARSRARAHDEDQPAWVSDLTKHLEEQQTNSREYQVRKSCCSERRVIVIRIIL